MPERPKDETIALRKVARADQEEAEERETEIRERITRLIERIAAAFADDFPPDQTEREREKDFSVVRNTDATFRDTVTITFSLRGIKWIDAQEILEGIAQEYSDERFVVTFGERPEEEHERDADHLDIIATVEKQKEVIETF